MVLQPCDHPHNTQEGVWTCLLNRPLSTIQPVGRNFLLQGEEYREVHVLYKRTTSEIALVQNEETREYFFYKRSKHPKATMKVEAALQNLADCALRQYGMTWAIPRVHQVFDHPVHGRGFLMDFIQDGETFANFLQNHIQWGIPREQNDRILVEILVQLAIYISILEHSLQMNHRDLKSTNVVLIQESEQPFTLSYLHQGKRCIITTRLRTSLVDFGVACVPYRDGILAGGHYLPTLDGCPKSGRDFFLFLSHLWNVEALRNSMSPRLKAWFTERLQNETQNWAQTIMKQKDRTMRNVYIYTSSEPFSAPHCSPGEIMQTLGELYPHVVLYS